MGENGKDCTKEIHDVLSGPATKPNKELSKFIGSDIFS